MAILEVTPDVPTGTYVPDVPSQTLQLPQDDISELADKLEKLQDFVSGQNVKIFSRLDSLEKGLHSRLDSLKKKMSNCTN